MGIKVIYSVDVTCDICGREIKVETELQNMGIRSHMASHCIASPTINIGNKWQVNGFFSDHPSYVYCDSCGEKYTKKLKELKEAHDLEMKNARRVVTEEVRKGS
jgi:ribosomal protein S27E